MEADELSKLAISLGACEDLPLWNPTAGCEAAYDAALAAELDWPLIAAVRLQAGLERRVVMVLCRLLRGYETSSRFPFTASQQAELSRIELWAGEQGPPPNVWDLSRRMVGENAGVIDQALLRIGTVARLAQAGRPAERIEEALRQALFFLAVQAEVMREHLPYQVLIEAIQARQQAAV